MRIKIKAFLIVALVALLSSSLIYSVSTFFLFQNSAEYEKAKVGKDIERLDMCVSNELSRLSSSVGDWANWDDTYLFVQDNNTDYITSNLMFEAFNSLNINLILCINNDGLIVYQKLYNLTDGAELSLSSENLSSKYTFISNQGNGEISGVLRTNNYLILVSSKPILKSNYEGPAMGALVFGRIIDLQELTYFSDTVGLQVDCVQVNDLQMPPDFVRANASLATGDHYFANPINDVSISGYGFLKDIHSDPVGILKVINSRSEYAQTQISVQYLAVAVASIGLILVAVIWYLLDRLVLRRLTTLSRTVEKVTVENRSIIHDLGKQGSDELTTLTSKIGQMLDTISSNQVKLQDYAVNLEDKVAEKTRDLIKAQTKLLQNERLAIVGQMAAIVAHDLRNPLASIKNVAFALGRVESIKLDPNVNRLLVAVDNSLEAANRIVSDLLDYSKEVKLEKQKVGLNNIISNSILDVRVPKNVELNTAIDNSLEVELDVNKMKRVFINLINNAIDAMPNGGRIEIKSSLKKDDVLISFADSGKGISAENLGNLWKPLFTTKSKGTGLGLVICKRFVEAHGGLIAVASEVEKGTVFTINLPLNR